MNDNYNRGSLLEKLAKDPYKYKVGPIKIESPVKLRPPIKRKDTRAFVTATALGSVASKYNRAKINNGEEVGSVGRFMAENPMTTMIGANVAAGLGTGSKNAIQDKLKQRTANKIADNVKVAETERSEFEKYASHGFLTSKETEQRFLEEHKPSELALVKLAFALEACGELHKIDHLIEKGGDKILDEYMKVAYDVCSDGIEKKAGAVRRALVNGAAGFLSGGATNLTGYIPNTIAASALNSAYNKAGSAATSALDKGMDKGIDKVIDFEMQMKRNKREKLRQQGLQKVASYQAVDVLSEIEKIDQAFLDRDAQSKASIIAAEYEKIASEKEALNSLLGNKIATYNKEVKAIQDFDDFVAGEDDSDIGLEDEIKLANNSEAPEDSLESAVEGLELDPPLDASLTEDSDEENDSIWNEDPSDLIE